MIKIIQKLKRMLNRKQKKDAIILLILMIIGAGLETCSVSLILPLVNMIIQPSSMQGSRKVYLSVLLFGLAAIFVIKNIYLYIEYYLQAKYVYSFRLNIQSILFEKYMNQPYTFFLSSNTGDILRYIMNDSNIVAHLLKTILGLLTESLVSFMLIITIVVINPPMAVFCAIIICVVLAVINYFIKPVLYRAGMKMSNASAMSNQWIVQIMNGIKEIKIMRKEEFFSSKLKLYLKQVNDSEKIYQVLGNLPRLLLEACMLCGILCFLGVYGLLGGNLNRIIPAISAFAMASIRLLPSVNRISSNINSMAYQEAALNNLIKNLYEEPGVIIKKVNPEKIDTKCEIALKEVSYQYPNSEKRILDRVNLEIRTGQTVGIIGESGAGKSTLVDLILGLLHPIEGTITINGYDMEECYSSWLEKVSYIPQQINLIDDSILANIAFGIQEKKVDKNMVYKALQEAQLEEFIKELPEGINTKIGERGVRLSGGQRQRIGIARALYTNPEFLVFDEATSALDHKTESDLMEAVQLLRGRKTMIIIAHRLSTLDICDIVYKVENGKVVKEGASMQC